MADNFGSEGVPGRKGDNPGISRLPTYQSCSSTSQVPYCRPESGDANTSITGTTTQSADPAPQLKKPDARKSESDPNIQDDLRCSICMDYLIDPTLTDCAHVFCNFCIRYWFENRGSSICPQCRNLVQQVFPSPDLKDRVEKYISRHLTPELLEEREKTRRTRQQEMNSFTHQELPINNPESSSFSNSLADIDDLFWTVTMDQQELPDLSAIWPGGYSTLFSNNSFVEPPARPDDTSSDEVDEALQQFEYRLDRAQRAYGVLVSAQREMNHQLEHLHAISHRLERFDRSATGSSSANAGSFLPSNSTVHFLSADSDIPFPSANPDTHFLSTNSANPFLPRADESSLLENSDSASEDLRSIPFPQLDSSTNSYSSYSSQGCSSSNDLWQWLPCSVSPCSHCYLPGNSRHHPTHCSSEHNRSSNSSRCLNGRSSHPGTYDYRCSECSSLTHPPSCSYSSASYLHGQQSPSFHHSPTPTSTNRTRPRRRRFSDNYRQFSGSGTQQQYPDNYQPSSSPLSPLPPTNLTLDDEYLEELRNQIADNEFAEAIERSLVMDMFEPHFDGHQQISVRSSHMSGPSNQNITSISIETDFLPDLNPHCQQRDSVGTTRRHRPSNGSRRRQLH